MFRDAAPEFVICSVCGADWPITTVLKLKLVAERESAGVDVGVGEGVVVEDLGETLAQP